MYYKQAEEHSHCNAPEKSAPPLADFDLDRVDAGGGTASRSGGDDEDPGARRDDDEDVEDDEDDEECPLVGAAAVLGDEEIMFGGGVRRVCVYGDEHDKHRRRTLISICSWRLTIFNNK